MTPPAATAAARGTLRTRPAPRHRDDGPRRANRARTRWTFVPRAPRADERTARAPLAVRLGHAAMRVGDARLLDRLVRGRAWIALLAAGLMGIVFMQVSLLRLNAGISRAVTAADTLDRQNSSLRADISRLDSGERIQDVAAKLGMVLPPAGDVHYLDGREANGRRAAAAIKPPSAAAQAASGGPAAAGTAPASATAAPATGTATTASATPATGTATPAATAAATTAPPAQAAAPAGGASATGQAAPAQGAATGAATAGGATAAGG
jgi:cell division protein FtsL